LSTSLRLVAELLVEEGRDDVAALIMLAAERGPAAPRLGASDRARADAVVGRAWARLGEAVHAGLAAAATAIERTDVLDRALEALGGLEGA
jgi:hypothetical protein